MSYDNYKVLEASMGKIFAKLCSKKFPMMAQKLKSIILRPHFDFIKI
jgi:hypothetical protein